MIRAFALAELIAGLITAASPRNHEAASSSPLARQVEGANGDEIVRPGSQGARVLRVQILLDRARFSPGQIDARYGDDLGVAIRSYQEVHNLNVTGIMDPETWKLLNADTRPLLKSYTITAFDLKGPFAPIPRDVQEQARMKYMGYESPAEGLGEKFHSSPRLLMELNPDKHLDSPGESIVVPNVVAHPPGRAVRVVLSKSKRTVIAYGAGDRVIAEYPATMGGGHDPLPIGRWTIVNIDHNPWFNYDPIHFWNASPGDAAAKLPPGPRNPAGVVWMGLSKPHYGIHGTPDPGRIRHGESAGCIRLTNWDALDLSRMVRRGTLAILEE